MIISRRSWHYKIIDFTYPGDLPKTSCQYFWCLIKSIFVIFPLIIIGLIFAAMGGALMMLFAKCYDVFMAWYERPPKPKIKEVRQIKEWLASKFCSPIEWSD